MGASLERGLDCVLVPDVDGGFLRARLVVILVVCGISPVDGVAALIWVDQATSLFIRGCAGRRIPLLLPEACVEALLPVLLVGVGDTGLGGVDLLALIADHLRRLGLLGSWGQLAICRGVGPRQVLGTLFAAGPP